jgi:hypothetical protein
MSLFAVDTSQPDLEELARFFAAQTGDSEGRIHERLAWHARNPSRTPDLPFALLVRGAPGAIAGAMLCIPHRIVNGSREYTAVMSSGFYVDRSIRGAGIQIFLQYRALRSRFVLYATTANAEAARLWQWAGARPLARTDHEMLRPIRWPSVFEEMLVRRIGRRAAPLARMVAPLANLRAIGSGRGSGGELAPVDRPDDAVTPSHDQGLQPVRDVAFIRWRFFEVPQVDAKVYRYRNERFGADGFVALTRSRRGYRGQIRTLFVADVWGTVPAQAFPALLDAITQRHRHTDDVLAIRCAAEPYAQEALAASCIRRDFEGTVGWYIDDRGVLGAGSVLMPIAVTELV